MTGSERTLSQLAIPPIFESTLVATLTTAIIGALGFSFQIGYFARFATPPGRDFEFSMVSNFQWGILLGLFIAPWLLASFASRRIPGFLGALLGNSYLMVAIAFASFFAWRRGLNLGFVLTMTVGLEIILLAKSWGGRSWVHDVRDGPNRRRCYLAVFLPLTTFLVAALVGDELARRQVEGSVNYSEITLDLYDATSEYHDSPFVLVLMTSERYYLARSQIPAPSVVPLFIVESSEVRNVTLRLAR